MAFDARCLVFDVIADDPAFGVKAGDTITYDPVQNVAVRCFAIPGDGVMAALFRGTLVPVPPKPDLALCEDDAAPRPPRRRRTSKPPALAVVRGGLARSARGRLP